jgi:hypothetical protein
VVTYPIDSTPGKRAAALAWEADFIELARGELSRMAAAGNLSLAFQAERCAGGVMAHVASRCVWLSLRVRGASHFARA